MNQKDAKCEAWNPTKTWGEYKKMVDIADTQGMSKVNKSLTRLQSQAIFHRMLKNKNLEEIPQTLTTRNFKPALSRDGLALMNLLREFG